MKRANIEINNNEYVNEYSINELIYMQMLNYLDKISSDIRSIKEILNKDEKD